MTIDVVLPTHLRTLAGIRAGVSLEVEGEVTTRAILDELEARYPVLRGTIRDYQTLRRRPFLRFFACGSDVSLDSPDAPLPRGIAERAEPFMIVGATAGG